MCAVCFLWFMVYGFNHLFESFESYFFIYAFKDLWHSFAFETFFLSLRFVWLCTSYMCNIQRIFFSNIWCACCIPYAHFISTMCAIDGAFNGCCGFCLKKTSEETCVQPCATKMILKPIFVKKTKVSKIWALIKFKKSQMHINHSLILIQTIGTFIIFLLLFLNFLWIKLKLNYDFAILIQENQKTQYRSKEETKFAHFSFFPYLFD